MAQCATSLLIIQGGGGSRSAALAHAAAVIRLFSLSGAGRSRIYDRVGNALAHTLQPLTNNKRKENNQRDNQSIIAHVMRHVSHHVHGLSVSCKLS